MHTKALAAPVHTGRAAAAALKLGGRLTQSPQGRRSWSSPELALWR